MTRILVVEDDKYLLSGLVLALERYGYSVDCASTEQEARSAISQDNHDLVLLDLGLPGCDGLELLAELRKYSATIPVIVITARDGVQDRIKGLNSGANDYLVKPFDVGELEARIRAHLRQAHNSVDSHLELGEIRLDPESGHLVVAGTETQLTPKETAVLRLLMERPGRVVSKKQIIHASSDPGDPSSENAVEIIIHRLRKKLEPGGVSVSTVRGFGYKLEQRH